MDSNGEETKINGQNGEHNNTTNEEEELSRKKKGGLITMPFIIANESFEKVASYGLIPNMIMYLMKDYKMSIAKGSNVLFLWTAATNFFPVVGAFVADSFLGRFLTIALGSLISFLGISLLWLTTVIPQAKPPPCNPLANDCQSPTSGQYTLLILAFLLMSLGAGGVRPCSQAFGADQVDQRDNPKNRRVLETFFNWYYACACLAVVIGLTVIVYIQDHFGWRIGFGIPAILMFISAVSFFLASPFYVKNKVKKSLLTSLAQAAVSAYKNRKLELPNQASDVNFYNRDSAATVPSDKLRFLNKACLIMNRDHDINPDGSAKNPWTLCTVDEVEQLKILIRVLPIWSSGLMMSVNTSQNSFPLLIAKSMNRHLGSKFEIPAGSFGTFTVLVIVIWIPVYDRLILPIASKLRGKQAHIGVKLRMGIGLFCTFLSVLTSGIVEHVRRQKAISSGFANNGDAVIHMSAMWLIPSNVFNGLAESFNAIGQTEFYYTEFPKSMSSIATCLFGVGMAVASLLASVIFNLVDGITKQGGKTSWVDGNVNQGHYDYYYWLLAILSFINVFYYVLCSWSYGPIGDKKNEDSDHEKENLEMEEELAMLRNTSRQEKGDYNLKEDLCRLSKLSELEV